MAKERGMADTEAGISMRSWGWMAYKKRDAVVCPKCGCIVLPGAAPGTFDFPNVGIPECGESIDVEVKAGDASFPFSDLRENQREWAGKPENADRAKFIWLCLGRGRPTSSKEPRITYFFPLELFVELENKLDRKSIPYDLEELRPYRLFWRGGKKWGLPDTHPMMEIDGE